MLKGLDDAHGGRMAEERAVEITEMACWSIDEARGFRRRVVRHLESGVNPCSLKR